MKRKEVKRMGIFGGIRKLAITAATIAAIAYAGDAYDAKPKIDALLGRSTETVQLQKYANNGKVNTYISYYDGQTKTEVPVIKGEFGMIIGDPAQLWQNLSEAQKDQYFLQEWQNLPKQKKGTLVTEAYSQLPLEARTQLMQADWRNMNNATKQGIVKQELEQALNSYYGGERK